MKFWTIGSFFCSHSIFLDCSWHLIAAIYHFKAIEKDYFLKCEGIGIVIVWAKKKRNRKWNGIALWWWLKLLLLVNISIGHFGKVLFNCTTGYTLNHHTVFKLYVMCLCINVHHLFNGIYIPKFDIHKNSNTQI